MKPGTQPNPEPGTQPNPEPGTRNSTVEQQYIDRVAACLPPSTPLRSQIALELRSLIEERAARGERLEDVLRQLGDPRTLAESYLREVPLVSAPFLTRAIARIVDVLVIVAGVGALALLAGAVLARREPGPFASALGPFLVLMAIGFGVLAYVVYAILSEYLTGQTLGKRLFHMRVVRESGAHISLGQAIVRQLPTLMQFFWIDILFALFTDRSQRAFELLSKTRVVQIPEDERASARVTMARSTMLA
jgi:uncharacterized RDD family membrane protein YckC